MAVDTVGTATASALARPDARELGAPSPAPMEADPPGGDPPASGPPLVVASRSTGRFTGAAVAAALLVGIYVIWMASHPSGQARSGDVDVVVKLAAAALAAASCFVLGRRATPEVRLAWRWTGAFATLWAIGEGVVTYYTFVGSGAVPFPSLADAAFLAALPLAAVGILWFPSVHRHGVFRARLPLEGTIVAGSLLIASWTTALGTVYHSGSGSVFSQTVGLAYPISDVILATVALSMLGQSRRRQRPALALVVAGLVCLAVTDSSLAYLAHTSFRYSTLVDAGRLAGWLLIALGPLWPTREIADEEESVDAPSKWQLALPYVFLALAIKRGSCHKRRAISSPRPVRGDRRPVRHRRSALRAGTHPS